jgi:hypothetical protein
VTFTSDIPYEKPGFWSITMYDAANNYTVPNPINRYMLGSDSHDLKRNADGSFTIYIQRDSPGPDYEANWLPSPPGPFYMTPRALFAGPGHRPDADRPRRMAGPRRRSRELASGLQWTTGDIGWKQHNPHTGWISEDAIVRFQMVATDSKIDWFTFRRAY